MVHLKAIVIQQIFNNHLSQGKNGSKEGRVGRREGGWSIAEWDELLEAPHTKHHE